MTTLVGAQVRRKHLAFLAGLALAAACDDAKPDDAAKATPSPPVAKVEDPETLGLEDGQLWRLTLEGEAPLAGQFGGQIVKVLRKGDDLSLSLSGEAIDVVITLEQTPMGQVGRFPATPARVHATTPAINCSTAGGGAIRVNLTHNEVERVAGRIEGKSECTTPGGAEARWSGAFDYSGPIDFK